MRLFLLLSLLASTTLGWSQMWVNVTTEQEIIHQINPPGEYGAGVSLYDVNHDGWDDLTLCNNGADITLHLNNEGVFEPAISIVENSFEAKHVTWVDFDNDGDADLFLTCYNAPFKLFENDGDLNLTDISASAGLPETFDLTFGHCWGDYNRDGWLDLYICNYNGSDVTNIFFKNNGDGTFANQTEILGIGDGTCHSFQPSFLDINNDLWPEIFIANDRLNCRNTLFLNTEGEFTDITDQAGLSDYIFSMNNTAADFDHDGDLDIYITNNPTGNRFKRNNGDETFSEIADISGVSVYDHSWSAQWVDINNDTWEDLHVCVSPFWNQPGQNRFFLNNGVTFEDITYAAGLVGDENWSHSSAVGDFNNDGFPDIFVVNDVPNYSQLFESLPNDNNFVKVLLNGTISNRDGIGSWIDVYAGNTHQRRYTQCGEGYLSQNSRTEMIGLGQADIIDSLIVSWPSGIIDAWHNLPVNQTYNFTEGLSDSAVVIHQNLVLCPGAEVLLSASAEPEDVVVWSNGSENDSIYINSPGPYWYQLTNAFGTTLFSDTVYVTPADSLTISLEPMPSNCAHLEAGSILTNFEGSAIITQIFWNDSLSDDPNLNPAPHGWNQIEVLTEDGCHYIDSTYLEVPDSLVLEFTVNQPVCSPYGSVDYQISGGAGGYVLDWGSLNPFQCVGGEYNVSLSDMAGCMLDTVITVNEGPYPVNIWVLNVVNAENGMNGSAGLSVSGGTPPYSILWLPMGIENVYEINGLGQGIYTIEVTDVNGCMDEAQFSIIDTDIPEIQIPAPLPYPNPFNEQFAVEIHSLPQFTISLYSITGRKVLEQSCNSSNCIVHTPNLPSGIYAIQIETELKEIIWNGIISKL